MNFTELSVRTGNVLLTLLPYLIWCVFWLWAVNGKKAWPVLAQGGWAPVVLLMVTITLAWSRIANESYDGLGFVTVPNFWWQLGAVSVLVALALFCGWLQGYFHMTPPDIEVEPPAVAHAHGHDHGHH
jgi:hypothetical protein